MRIFISAGEPSGDLHGANLIRALQNHHPGIECVGFGGERMESAGGRLLYPLCQLAVMWLARVLARAPLFLQLLSRADRFFRHHRPDAVVLIDYPGFHWWLARRAHFHRIPVFWFVPPQLWGWGGWRVRKMQRWVDHVLCTLPFEQPWYAQRGVAAEYVGHPYFDELAEQCVDADFLARQQADGRPVIGLLPGSRNQEVDMNLPTLLDAATRIHAARPETRFLFACFKDAHQRQIDAALRGRGLPAETCVGRTPEIIRLAHSCIAVSGSVGLELLYHRKPSVVVYRMHRAFLWLLRKIATARYVSLVNLLAGRELFPEYPTERVEGEAAAGHVLRWLSEPAEHQRVVAELAALREQVAQPGACERAARFILDALNARTTNQVA